MDLTTSDGYKQSHRVQYPEGTEYVYSNWTPRSGKHATGTKEGVVVFGIQALILKIKAGFNRDFFGRSEHDVVSDFQKRLTAYLGAAPDVEHVRALHQLGYLPIKIKALKEGTLCPFGVPMMTIINTDPRFYWLPNALETLISTELWLPMTSATIAYEFKKTLTKWSDITCDDGEHLSFQAHDFSMRGMAGLDAAAASGAGHLLSFSGTDTIPAIDYLEKFYFADCTKELIGVSIPATEHSVMSMGTKDDELGTFKRLITDIYPSGFVSIVSDTWDLWKVLTEYAPALKEEIMARDGRVVFRPDSGNPVDIICGTVGDGPVAKGVIELLWDTFGGTVNSKGFKVLDPHVGAIYGDSITLDRAEEICSRLHNKGFASSNIVFGVGSYTYQYNTRDTYGFAMKATAGVVNGEIREIFKDPITDDGTKKSLKGLLYVRRGEVTDQVDWEQEDAGDLLPVFKDGLGAYESFSTIKERLTADS